MKKLTREHINKIIKSRSWYKHSEQTKKKIGDKHRRPIYYNCDLCNKKCVTKLSAYRKKKKHFCSMKCYKEYVKTLPFYLQHAYKGVRGKNDSKQVYHRNYVKKNKINMSHLKARRYAKEKGAVGNHTLKEWLELKKLNNFCCAMCGENKKLTKDHIIPLSKGGTDFIENIQPLCKNCNSKKHNKILNPELLEEKNA